jgi:hypothetical protein
MAEQVEHKYTAEIKSDGRRMFYRDGRLIRRLQVPQEELVRIQREMEVQGIETVDDDEDETAIVEPEPAPDECLVCGQPATRQRFANLQLLHLCEEHYFKCTLGYLVITLREKGQYEPVLPNN